MFACMHACVHFIANKKNTSKLKTRNDMNNHIYDVKYTTTLF